MQDLLPLFKLSEFGPVPLNSMTSLMYNMTYMCISFVVPVTKLFVDSAHFKCLEQHDPHDSCSVPFPSETISRQDFEATNRADFADFQAFLR